ncbi:MAG: glycosyltransferase family 4 protein [Pseudomonadota bacterium]
MTGPAMRICFVAPSAYPVLAGDRSVKVVGGAEVQQSFIARELARRGHEVSMISTDHGQREGDEVHGVRLLKMCAPDAGLPVLRFVHPRLTSLWAAMKRADADIYYQRACGALTGFVAAFARRHGRRMVFAGAHDFDFEPALPLIAYRRDKALYRWGLARADQVVVQSERQLERCREVFGREALRVRSCYGHQGRPARQDGVVLWAASVKPIKRPELFLDLAELLPELRFKLIGGPGAGAAHFDALRARAARLGNVEMTGFVPHVDVEAHFDGAAVFVNTAVSEGFPNTFLQAWSRGMPTVSFFDPGAQLDGEPVGTVVPDLDAMVLAVQRLKTDAAAWRREGERAAEYLRRHHAVGTVVDEYERIFERLVMPGGMHSQAVGGPA